MDGVNKRISQIIKDKGLNNNSFSKKIRVNPQTVHNITKEGGTKPSYEVLNKILESFPDLNANWLMTGEEPKYLDFTDGISGGLDFKTDKDFNLIAQNLSLLNKLLASNPIAKSIDTNFQTIETDISLLNSYIEHYSLINSLRDKLDQFNLNKISMSDLNIVFKERLKILSELYELIQPYKEQLEELYLKVSEFNKKHDNIYELDLD